jgi:ribose transport system permease protein
VKKELGISVLLLVLCGFTALKNPQFLSPENLSNTANSIGMYGIFSIGIGLVIITGGIELSVGSMLALTGVLLSMALREWHWPWPLAALFVVALSMSLGAVHGFLITRFRMQPFIVTLCGLLIYRGVARFIAHDSTKGFSVEASTNPDVLTGKPGIPAVDFETLRHLAHGKLLGVPMPFVLLLIIAPIMWAVLHRSVYGRYLMAVGQNEDAARFSGIRSRLVIGSSYVVAGLLTGISSILFAFYTSSIAPSNHGNFYELYGIAAAVLGGCSLRGGEGSILGIVIGTALLQVLRNLVNLLGIDSSLEFVVMGAVVLTGVLADQWMKARAAKKGAR